MKPSNKTKRDARDRIDEARKNSLLDAAPEYLKELEEQITGWLEIVRDYRMAKGGWPQTPPREDN